jgi:putative membrane protein insertion efficiency factor
MRIALVKLIGFYQYLLSPLKPPSCRFTPTCSQYACEAITRHGVWVGTRLGMMRLLRCHPWNPGGYDPVP